MNPRVAAVAVLTKTEEGFFITLGEGDHSCDRWKITESLAKKLRRELNEKLD